MESPDTGGPTASSAQALLASPEIPLPLSVAAGNQRGAVVASAGDLSLVVWSETDASGAEDLRGMRVRKSDGALLDATPLCIACGPRAQRAPAVASNGTDFLVTWDDYMDSGYPRVVGVRVRGSDGAVLGSPQVLGDGFPANDWSSIASNGSDYLVVWRSFSFTCNSGPWGRQCTYVPTLSGARVSAATGSSSFVSVPSTGRPLGGAPQVTYGGGNYLVTWAASPNGDSPTNLYSVRLRGWDGVVLGTFNPLIAGGKNHQVASDGSRFLLVYTTPGNEEIRAARLGQDGAVLDSGGFRVGLADSTTPANVFFDGTDYRVAWEQGQSLVRPVLGMRVTREGLLANVAPSVLGELSMGDRPALTLLGRGRFLLGYTKLHAPPMELRVKLRVVEDQPLGMACTRDAQCQSGFCVDGVCCESACGGGSAQDCQACGVAAGGAVDGMCGAVRSDVVCRPSAVACDVAERCDGTGLSCPADERGASEPDLSGDKCEDSPCEVAAWLATLGPESLEPSFGQGLQGKAEAACEAFQSGDTQAMRAELRALSHAVRAQAGKKLSASAADTLLSALSGLFRPSACVAVASPAPVEPLPVPPASVAQGPFVSPELSLPLLLPATGVQSEVAAASAGDITLVVWSETDASGYTDVRGMRVRRSDGALLDGTPLCIACSNGIEYTPAVASNGTDFLVTWTEQPNTSGIGAPRVRGVRVKGSEGAVSPPYLSFGSGGPPNWRSSVASNGSSYLVVWHGYQLECVWIPGQSWPSCGYRYTVVGTQVGAEGAWNGTTFALAPAGFNPTTEAPQANYGAGHYLVTWTGHPAGQSASNPSAYATRVRASDNGVLDGTPGLLASGANASGAAFEGSRFLVTWSTLAGEVRASRLALDGEVLDPGGFLVGMGSAANVLFDGAAYRVAWEQGRQQLVRQLKGVEVTREGLVVAGSELVFAENRYASASTASERPALAPLGAGRFLVGYTKHPGPPLHQRGVKLRRVEHIPQGLACTQDAQCQSGFCVDGVCCDSACGGGLANDCQACGVAAGAAVDGTCGAVRAEAAVTCRPSAMACDVAEVCDGTGLSCPADERGASEPDLTCDKCQDNPCDVANYLASLGPELLLQPIGQSLQRKADAACGSFQSGDVQATRSQLEALLNTVRAQSGKKLSTPVANTLTASLTGLLNL